MFKSDYLIEIFLNNQHFLKCFPLFTTRKPEKFFNNQGFDVYEF